MLTYGESHHISGQMMLARRYRDQGVRWLASAGVSSSGCVFCRAIIVTNDRSRHEEEHLLKSATRPLADVLRRDSHLCSRACNSLEPVPQLPEPRIDRHGPLSPEAGHRVRSPPLIRVQILNASGVLRGVRSPELFDI